MTSDVQAALKALPPSVRRSIKSACGGDWDRVVVGADKSITIYNTPALAARARARGDVPPGPRSAAPPRPPEPIDELADYVPDVDDEPEPPRAPRKTLLEALAEKKATYDGPPLPGLGVESQDALDRLREHARRLSEPIAPPAAPAPVKVDYAPAGTRRPREVLRRDGDGSDFDPRVLIEHAQKATDLQEFLAAGLPGGAAYLYFPEVADLYGMDFELVDAALRQPTEVTIRPETVTKGYPVLRFARGDLEVIMGFRDPQLPMVIAVYFLSRLDREGRRVTNYEQSRPPATGGALLRHLRGMGAQVSTDDAKPVARVVYKDRELGKVSMREHDRDAIKRDFERMARKIRGVDAAIEKEEQDADGPR